MLVRNDVSQNSPNSARQPGPVLGWRELAIQQGDPVTKRRRRILGILSILLLIMLIFAALRVAMLASATNDQVLLHIGNQQVVTLDLRQSLPINENLLGTNVFPQFGTTSRDNAYGSMNYSPVLTAGLKDADIKLLRFPGGRWGEDHYLSLNQLSAFSTLLQQTNANGMVQARLSGPIHGNFTD